MREIFTSGSVGGAPGNRCFYLEADIKKRRSSFLVALLFAAADVRRSQRENLTLTYIGG